MGCSGSKKVIRITVPVPEHGSGLALWGDVHWLQALTYLLEWHTTASMTEQANYLTPYVVHPSKGAEERIVQALDDAGQTVLQAQRTPSAIIANVPGEVATLVQLLEKKGGSQKVMSMMPYRPASAERFALDMDRRRICACLYMHLPLIVAASCTPTLTFVGKLDEAFINRHLPSQLAMSHKQLKAFVALFHDMTPNKSGALTIPQFEEWIKRTAYDGAEAESVFLDFVFLVNGRPQSPGHLDVHEFILALHSFLTMSHEEMMEHFFACMADSVTEDGLLAIKMRKITRRYPKLKRANDVRHTGNEMLLTEFTNLAEARNVLIQEGYQPRHVSRKFSGGNIIHNPARDKRFKAPVSTGFVPHMPTQGDRHTIAMEGQLCTRKQFLELCLESHYIMGPMYMLQTLLHKKVLGVGEWTRRAYVVRDASGGKLRPRTAFLTRSISRQQLHTQHSGQIRVSRATNAWLDAMEAGEAAPEGGPQVPRGTGEGAIRGSISESKGTDKVPEPPISDEEDGVPVEVAGNGTRSRSGSQTVPVKLYQWVHHSDGRFTLEMVKDRHADDESDVLSALTEVDHDHSKLDALSGKEPLRALDSMLLKSHYPPLNPGLRQRRHTFTLGAVKVGEDGEVLRATASAHVSGGVVPKVRPHRMSAGERRRAHAHDMGTRRKSHNVMSANERRIVQNKRRASRRSSARKMKGMTFDEFTEAVQEVPVGEVPSAPARKYFDSSGPVQEYSSTRDV